MSVELWKSLFDWATVVLIALTVVSGAGALITGGIISKRQEAKLHQFDSDLTSAKTELVKQQERAASAEAKASEAKTTASDALAKQQNTELELKKQEERAAVAEKTLLELKNTLADRALSDKQVEVIANKLRSYEGQEYELVAYWDSKESVGIANRIHAALQLAQWKYLKLDAWHGLLGGVVGVQVWIHPDADPKTKSAAHLLVSALVAEGIEAESREQNPTNNPKHNKIALSIGAKR